MTPASRFPQDETAPAVSEDSEGKSDQEHWQRLREPAHAATSLEPAGGGQVAVVAGAGHARAPQCFSLIPKLSVRWGTVWGTTCVERAETPYAATRFGGGRYRT